VVVLMYGMVPFAYLEVGDQQGLVLAVAFHIGKVQKSSGILPIRGSASSELCVVKEKQKVCNRQSAMRLLREPSTRSG
jgi:hypothetical protein